MATSMFSLFATVFVLSLHYHDATVPVTPWLKKILLPNCPVFKNDVITRTVNSISDITEEGASVNEIDVQKIKENSDLSKASVIQIKLLCNMWREIAKTNNKESSVKHYPEWKIVAKRLDNIFLYLFLSVTILINITLFCMF